VYSSQARIIRKQGLKIYMVKPLRLSERPYKLKIRIFEYFFPGTSSITSGRDEMRWPGQSVKRRKTQAVTVVLAVRQRENPHSDYEPTTYVTWLRGSKFKNEETDQTGSRPITRLRREGGG